MRDVYERERFRGGTFGWILQAVSGILLLGLLGLHMIAQHFVVEGGLREYDQVLDYLANPVIFALELIFLVVVTYHALVGVRSIIFDWGLEAKQERTVTGVLSVIGVITIVYGIVLAVTLFVRAS